MDSKKKSFIIQLLRRGSYRWHTRWTAEKRSKLERNTYFCENPECGVIGPKRDFSMDHVQAVIDPEKGFEGFDVYADRMYPDTEFGWQRLCHPCHSMKSGMENATRKETRLKKKLDKE